MTPTQTQETSAPTCPPSPPTSTDAGLEDLVRQVDAGQERDLWWGGYAARHMLPSLLVCLVLTGVIVWFGFTLGRSLAQPMILGVSSVVWLVQIARWGFRVFGINYRLSTHRLFCDRGFLNPRRLQAKLSEIRDVRVEQDRFEKLIGVGRVVVESGDRAEPRVVLIGVKEPQIVAGRIRRASESAASLTS